MNYKRITAAHVYVREHLAGRFDKLATDDFRFVYDAKYLTQAAKTPGDLPPLSLTLPFQPEPYRWDHVPPFFDNLVVEGWLLERIGQVLKIDKTDRFALLMAAGQHASGAVSVVPILPDEQEHKEAHISQSDIIAADSYKKKQSLTLDGELHHWRTLTSPFAGLCASCLEPSPRGDMHPACRKRLWDTTRTIKILLPEVEPERLFVHPVKGQGASGAQRKGLFYLSTDGGLARFRRDWRAVYIVKPEGSFPEFPANEHVTMAIAAHWGLKTAAHGLFTVDDLGLIYVTRRFDWLGPKRTDRLLMEDFAQLGGMTAAEKSHGSMEQVATLVEQFTTAPVIQKADLFRRILFCYVTANADMHLKNWAILATPQGDYALSPAYDLTNTRIALGNAEDIDINLPLQEKQTELTSHDFRRYGLETLGLTKAVVDKAFGALNQLGELIHTLVPRSALSDRRKRLYLQLAAERLARLAR